jgi:hypothetical protein
MATRPLVGWARNQRNDFRACTPEHSHPMASFKENAFAAIKEANPSSTVEPGSLP